MSTGDLFPGRQLPRSPKPLCFTGIGASFFNLDLLFKGRAQNRALPFLLLADADAMA
jgi:hypothetical protein